MFSFIDKIPVKDKIKKFWCAICFPFVAAAISFIICTPILCFIARGFKNATICGGIIAGMIFLISLSEQMSVSKREF